MPIIDTDPGVASRLSLRNIERAAAVIAPAFVNSPQYECEPLCDALGSRVTLKLESLNPLRCFKGRGVDFFMHEHASALAGRTLVCATAGNFGQAMAYACRACGLRLVVYCATTANPLKLQRMRAMGAEVRLFSEDFDAAKDEARRFCAETGARFVEDGFEPAISEGAGSIAVELLRHGERFDSVLVPLGNGALLAGMARWIKAHAPDTRVIGICAQGADAMAASWHERRTIARPAARTIADGIAVRKPVPEALGDLHDTVDDVLLVSDEAIERAMHLLFTHAGLLSEAAGAAGVAALIEHPRFSGQRVATVLCGSNLTDEQRRTLQEQP